MLLVCKNRLSQAWDVSHRCRVRSISACPVHLPTGIEAALTDPSLARHCEHDNDAPCDNHHGLRELSQAHMHTRVPLPPVQTQSKATQTGPWHVCDIVPHLPVHIRRTNPSTCRLERPSHFVRAPRVDAPHQHPLPATLSLDPRTLAGRQSFQSAAHRPCCTSSPQ